MRSATCTTSEKGPVLEEFEPHFGFLLNDHGFVVAKREKLDRIEPVRRHISAGAVRGD